MKFSSSARAKPSLVGATDGAADVHDDIDGGPGADRSIGAILRGARQLSQQQIEQVLHYQQQRGLPFGEAAVALRLATRDDVLWALSQQFQYPYAPALSGNPELAVACNPFGDQAEAFRELRSQLMMGVLAPEHPRRAVAVVSPERGDGKTFVAANLAVAFSQLGGHTLLIDADMRTPRQHQVFGIEQGSGLSNILSGRSEDNVIRPVRDLPNLFVLPVGIVPPNPLELVQRAAFPMLVHELLTRFDYVVVDTPAASHGPDARVVAAKCGAAVAIGRQGRSRLHAMHKLVAALHNGPAALAGVVMNER